MLEAPRYTVRELSDHGLLRVEDGNHGEYRPRKHEFIERGVSFIRAADLGDAGIDFASASKINHVARARIRKGIGQPKDVVLSHKGTVGKIAIAPIDAPPFVCSPQTTFWRSLDQETLDQEFLFAFVRCPDFRAQLHSRAGETDMAAYVSLTAQRTFWVPLPPIEVQREIVSYISSIDRKIGLNRRMNETLESMARAIFKDWFVDFGPTRAKAEGRTPYLAPKLWDLFPHSLDNEGKPVGWESTPLDEIAAFLNGVALQKFPASDSEESLPVIKIAELRGGITEKSGRASSEVPEKYVIRNGDFLFSWSGSLLAKFWTEGEGALNQHLFKVTSDRYPGWFVSQWVYHHLKEFQAIAASKATTMGHIQRRHLKEAVTTCPPDDVLAVLGQTVGPLVERTIKNNLEARTLSQTREILLPKLMSGEIRLGNMNKFVTDFA